MDHLPYPDDAEYDPSTVPYLAGLVPTRYDGKGFLDFKSRSGWEADGMDWFECGENSSLAAARAQVWLYFGLLVEFFGSQIQESDFTTNTPLGQGQLLSSSRKLPALLKKWAGARRWRILELLMRTILAVLLGALSGGVLVLFSRTEWAQRQMRTTSKMKTRLVNALREVETQTRKLEQRYDSSDDVARTCAAIRALLWSIRNASVNKDPDLFKRSRLELSSSPFLTRLLLERGFCPHELRFLQEFSSVATLHYISAYDYSEFSHGGCTTEECTAYRIDEETYVTQHANDCDSVGCEDDRADLTNLKNIIDSGKIPIISACSSPSGMRLDIAPVSPNVPYVAISHPWSGGLGNPRSSCLPRCQIRRIVNIIRPLFPTSPDSVSHRPILPLSKFRTNHSNAEPKNDESASRCAFWMDTLCIPTKHEVPRDTRDIALSYMNRIYAEATHVVVLDKTLKNTIGRSGLQIASSLRTSPWMTRCWTYLEGRLAQDLRLAANDILQDPFIQYHDIARRAFQFGYHWFVWDDGFQLRREMISTLYHLRAMKDSTVKYREDLSFVESWNEIVRRTTSRHSDLLIIFALMLELSIYDVKRIAPEARLLAILGTQKYLPMSFLFEGGLHGSRTLTHPRWLPEKIHRLASVSTGALRKMTCDRTKQNYHRIMVRRGAAYVVRVAGSRSAKMRIRAQSSVLPERIFDICASETNQNGLSNLSSGDESVDDIYIIPASAQSENVPDSDKVFGCRLRVVQDLPKSMSLAFDQTICCTTVHQDAKEEASSGQGVVTHTARALEQRKELRLNSDWGQWPSLRFDRSQGAKPMTSKQGPNHPFVILLFFFEMVIGVTTAALIAIVFPNAEVFADDFWTNAAPVEWFVWALCLALLFLRLYVVFWWELPSLNHLLRATESQRWTQSFAHASPSEVQAELRRPLSRPYQYSSWVVVVLAAAAGCLFLGIGLTLRRPMLYDLAIIGGYLLFQVTFRLSVEILWRLPQFSRYRHKLSDWAFEDVSEGMPDLNPSRWMSYGRLKEFISEPNLLTHHTDKLSEIFEDPVYFPEHYMRTD